MSGMSWSASFINSSLKICCIGVVSDRALFLMELDGCFVTRRMVMTKAISQETNNCGDLAFTGSFSASPIRGFFVNAILTVRIAV